MSEQPSMAEPVFYDPQRARWKRLRRLVDALVLDEVLVLDVVIPLLLPVDVLDPLLVAGAPPAPKSDSPETPPQAPRAAPEHAIVKADRMKRFM